MPQVTLFRCSSCRFVVASTLGGGMYARTGDGEWVRCLHPGEFSTAAAAIGVTAEDLDSALRLDRTLSELELPSDEVARLAAIRQRVRFTSQRTCFACGKSSEIDVDATACACPACGSERFYAANEALGRTCPNCGTGAIIRQSTGMWI